MAGVLAALFVGGLVITIVTVNRLARRAAVRASAQMPVSGNWKVAVNTANLPPGIAEKFAQVFGQPITEMRDNPADYLRQLDQARDQGLITQAEYDDMRPAILMNQMILDYFEKWDRQPGAFPSWNAHGRSPNDPTS